MTRRPRPVPAEDGEEDHEDRIAALERQMTETHDMVRALHAALIDPQPGQERGLLDRMAAATIRLESGDWAMKAVVRAAAVLIALGTLVAALKWGGPQK